MKCTKCGCCVYWNAAVLLRHSHESLLVLSSQRLPAIPTTVVERPFLIGHRGALYDELENTLPSFQRCLELGCDGVELDVYALKDDSLIVFHGGGTKKNSGDLGDFFVGMNGKSILDLDYEQTQELIFNDQYAEFGCDPDAISRGRIPTLSEILGLFKDQDTIIKIELKGTGTVQPTLRLVEEMDMVHQCHFSSFALGRIGEIRELHPERIEDGTYKYKTGALFKELPDDFLFLAEEVGASEVHLRYDLCTVDRISAIHARNMRSLAWFGGPIAMKTESSKWTDVGNEDDSMYLAVAETGVQQLCLNRPSVAIGLWAGETR
jgi:glycerophosphoryl diester phosphodiesterase